MRKIKYVLQAILILSGAVAALYYGSTLTEAFYVAAGILILLIALKLFIRIRKKLKYLNSGILQLDIMEGEEFEEWFALKLESMGYKTELTKASNDYGADILAMNRKERLIIQTKRYSDKVGIKAVQEVIGALSYYSDVKHDDITKGVVITNAYFTNQAKNLAERSGVELWDRDYLLDNIL